MLKRSVTGNIKGLTDAIAHDLIHLAPREGAAFWGPARVLGAIGVAASHHGHHDLAQDAFAQARSLIEEIIRRGDPWKTSWALVNLAEDQAEARDLESASATLESARSAARQIHKQANQVRMLAEIAKAEALGCMAADKTFQAALDIVCGEGRKSQCDEIAGLGEILEAQSKVGLNQKAIATLDLAEALLRSIDPTTEQVWLAETTLAVSLVKSARYFSEFKAGAIRHADESLRTSQHTRGAWERNWAKSCTRPAASSTV